MNWDAISAISETIASAAVVISLIYLAIQIKHANKQTQGQTRAELRHMAQSEVFKIIEYPVIAKAYYKEELTEDETIRLHNFLITAIRFREFIWRQHEQKLLDTATFHNYSMALLQVLGSKRCQAWWNNFKTLGHIDPRFAEFVDDLLAHNEIVDMKDIIKGLQNSI